ncbi:Pal1-domain-containing protein [Polychaeton citri CBS 116435]|uniref:Pal1-domain-containing protein n=1 Tax=Polychaeton citri CBS 116435 TaxID=1314669 RepID=A0A9P4Q0Z2_9PEZI|nr:Pal1-domain-containing protein [Polychaeton citri CBS 116435]
MIDSQQYQQQSAVMSAVMAPMDRWQRFVDALANKTPEQNEMSLLDKPASNGQAFRPPPRAGTLPAQKADERRDRSQGALRPTGSPQRGAPRQRPRGLSESSVMEKERDNRRERERAERPQRTESEERRRRERRREREERHRREKEKGKKTEKQAKGQRGLDIIDKLDVTGIYGQGLFHHDGPFDACNPHRNKARNRHAPMQAFPTDSMNMRLGGSGPINKQLNLDQIHGRGAEGFETYNSTRKQQEPQYFDAKQRADPVHGEETYGLGTSTFLEGAPVSRRELQRRESNDQGGDVVGGDLQRKKSLAQRLRGASQARRRAGSNADEFRSPEARYLNSEAVFDTSPPGERKPISAGGPSRAVKYTNENEINPFDNDYEAAYEKKGAQIKEQEIGASRQRAASSPKVNALQRSITADSAAGIRVTRGSDEQERQGRSGSTGGGLLSRMRSLKGGPRRPRGERRES